jgi:gliding motility-associated-like protein
VYSPIANGNVIVTAADGVASYAWDWGDGNTSTGANTTHPYNTPGDYDVMLSITTNGGCTITRSLADAVHITNAGLPAAAFTLTSDSVSICQLMEVKFNFAGSNHQSFYWDFGDGTTSTLPNPTHFYNNYGNYTATLNLTGNGGGCTASAQHSIQVIQPNSSMFNYAPISNCNEITVDFTITPPPSTSFTFSFGDGKSDNTQATTLQHYYGAPNTYSPVLTLTDHGGCIVGVGGANAIRVIGAEPFYSQDRKTFCDSGPVTFTNFIIGNDPVTSYTWDFGDGITSTTDPNPNHNYTSPGVYPTSLTVNTQSGCTKTLRDTVRVYRTPVPSIVSKDIVCIGDTVSFEGPLAVADTSITWNWNLGNGKTAATQNTNTIYNTAGNYTINFQATNLVGCSGSSTKNIMVAPPPVITKGPDPVIAVGTGVTLPVSYTGNINSYTWTPTGKLSCADCPVPFANPQFTTTYKIAVTDQNGCIASDKITVNVICNEENYFIPNTFSPNADGMNDLFYPRGKSLYTIRAMRVFNRWGELVYEKKDFASNNPSAGWNGLYKGKPAGKDVYVYIVEVVCENAQIVVLKGNVTLIR